MNSFSKNAWFLFLFLLISNISYGLGSQCLLFYSSNKISSFKLDNIKSKDSLLKGFKGYLEFSGYESKNINKSNIKSSAEMIESEKLKNLEIADGKAALNSKIEELIPLLSKNFPKSEKSKNEARAKVNLAGTNARDIELEFENLYGEQARVFAAEASETDGTQSMIKYSLFGDPRIDEFTREAITATMSTLGITKYTADAILANFDQEKRVPLDGTLGVFISTKNPNKPSLASSLNLGLPRAYNFIIPFRREITLESLLGARQLASAVLIDGKTSKFNYTPIEFKEGVVIAGKARNFSPHIEVLEKLERYGYKLFAEKIVSEGKEQDVVKIDFGSKDKVLENLRNFISELNSMISSKRDPYETIAFAVQELLIIHPFKDGNGRIARILGQRLGEELLNDTLFFPKEFFREMNYSHQELVSSLRTAHQKLAENRKTLDERRSKFLKDDLETNELAASAQTWGRMSFYKMDGIKLKKMGDQRFEPVIVNGRTVGRNKLRTKAPPHYLYFGAKRPNIRELYGSVRKYFESGRQIKGSNMHRDINRHQESKKSKESEGIEINGGGEFSAFIQTSSSFDVARQFAMNLNDKGYGFILIIDPKGAEVLELKDLTIRYETEREFVFDRNLDPRRIKGAILLINGKPFKAVENPNYDVSFVSEKASDTFN